MSIVTKILWAYFVLALLKPPEDMRPVLVILGLAIVFTFMDRHFASGAAKSDITQEGDVNPKP